MFKVNNKGTRGVYGYYRTYFIYSSGVSIVDFEQVNVGLEWALEIFLKHTLKKCSFQIIY